MTKELPSIETLRKLLRYEPETGKLFWRERTPDMFADAYRSKEGNCANWNSRYADKEAGSINLNGYVLISIHKKHLYAHRIAWAMQFCCWPSGVIDHINMQTSDNRIENLRDASKSQNAHNVPQVKKTESGYLGVSFRNDTKKWVARMKVNGHTKNLGCFDSKEEAALARHRFYRGTQG